MNTKSDWTAVHEQMLEEQRRRLGPPPTVEELEAYSRGELSPGEEDRVRALLVCYPDLARTLISYDDVEADDSLTPEQLAADWKSLQKRLPAADRTNNVLPFWRTTAAIAAALAVVFGGLLWRARSELSQPRLATEEYVLRSDGARGPGDDAVVVSARGELVLFSGVLRPQTDFKQYRLDLVSADGNKLWSSAVQPWREDGYFSLLIPRSQLERGRRYQVVLNGVDGARQEVLEKYSIRIAR